MMNSTGKKCCERVARSQGAELSGLLKCALCGRKLCAWHSAGAPAQVQINAPGIPQRVELGAICFPGCGWTFNLAREWKPRPA
jgi:hypothetical protein